MAKVNLDLAGTNSSNDIADELKSNVGSSAFDLAHDRFFGTVALLRIWTGAGETGTQLILDTDYTVQGLDSDLTAEAIAQVWNQVKIENVTYQTGNLYFNYRAVADEVDANDLLENVLTTPGDIITEGATGPERLASADWRGIHMGHDAINAGGAQVITGVGFATRQILLFANERMVGDANWSIGFDNGTLHWCHYHEQNVPEIAFSDTYSIWCKDNGNRLRATVTAIGGDGFTLTWDFAGAIIVDFSYLCWV